MNTTYRDILGVTNYADYALCVIPVLGSNVEAFGPEGIPD